MQIAFKCNHLNDNVQPKESKKTPRSQLDARRFPWQPEIIRRSANLQQIR